MGFTWDIESNNLLNEQTIDYNSSPYKLKDSFVIHCIVMENHESGEIIAFYDGDSYVFDGREYMEIVGGVSYTLTGGYEPLQYTHYQLSEFKSFVEQNVKNCDVVAHNGINFDWLVTKLYFGMDYTVSPDMWTGNKVNIVDTLCLSKTLNPDRIGGHSLDNLSKFAGIRKIDFRPHLKPENRFEHFAADMLYYCIFDAKSNTAVFNYLNKEASGWDWSKALELEKAVAELVTRQEHRGFKFDKTLAESNIVLLDSMMEERRTLIEPLIPPKPATKGFKDDFTPPKLQFKKDRTPSSNLVKFIDKIGGTLDGDVGNYTLNFNNKTYALPLEPNAPLLTTQVATLNDTTHIKEWLVSSFGWQPLEYKEKDLSVKTVKGIGKVKRTPEEVAAAIHTYVEQTKVSPFCADRCEHLGVTIDKLRGFLLNYKKGRAIKVLSNPSFTVGQEKEICPNLEKISEDFPYAKSVVEYLTFKHRRNSILGGGLDWEDEEEAEKGYMAFVREDGRIATPADTCGASTSRFKHKGVANIPRVSSLFGKEMRGLFGVDDGFIQFGYDFDSLEARIESHYCWRYDDASHEYCNSLLMDKPNDVHTQMAKKISAMISREFARSPAKSVKYSATYGALPPRIAKIIGESLDVGAAVFDAFWMAALPLSKLRDALHRYWEKNGKTFVLGIDGRKVPTRSAHAILNTLFQSAGVICAKRAAVIHDRLLKEAGLSVDLFKDDWKKKQFASQLIMYHDEAQLEVTQSLVKLKTFSTKEDAEKWKVEYESKNNCTLSDIGHICDKYYVGYCRAGELAVEAVRMAGEYYGLNVGLTAGYMLGRNWADCH